MGRGTRFSERFGIKRGGYDDCIDPDLTIDACLFGDPLLLLEAGE